MSAVSTKSKKESRSSGLTETQQRLGEREDRIHSQFVREYMQKRYDERKTAKKPK